MSQEYDTLASDKGIEKYDDRMRLRAIGMEMGMYGSGNDRMGRKHFYKCDQRILQSTCRKTIQSIQRKLRTSPTSSGNVANGILIGSWWSLYATVAL